jgi:WD40 repeat protein
MRHAGRVTHAIIHTNNQLVATASDDGYARVWERATGKLRMQSPSGIRGPSSIAFAPVDSVLAVSSGPGITALHRVGTSVFDNSVQRVGNFPAQLSVFSPDGTQLALAGQQRAAVIRVPGSESLLEVQHEARIGFVAFSPNGRWLVTASDDNSARVTGIFSNVKDPIVQRGPVVHAAFSADSRYVATASHDGTVSVFSLNEGTLVRHFTAHERPVHKVAFHPTEAVIASGAEDGRVLIWNATTGTQIGKPLMHPGPITDLSFDADGTKLLTSSENVARLWKLELSTDQAATITLPRDVNEAATLRPDLLIAVIVIFACATIAADTRLSARLRHFANPADPAPPASN